MEIEKSELIQMVLTIGAHRSPLELEIEKRDMDELIQMLLTIGAQWSPLELEIGVGGVGGVCAKKIPPQRLRNYANIRMSFS